MFNSNQPSLPVMGKYVDPDVHLSMEVPLGWRIGSNDFFKLILLAPEQARYQTILGFNTGKLDKATPQGLDELFAASAREEVQKYTNYQIIENKTFKIGDHYARLRRYEWSNQAGTCWFSQVEAAILGENGTICVTNGNCLKSQVLSDIPILEHIINSIRFVKTTSHNQRGMQE